MKSGSQMSGEKKKNIFLNFNSEKRLSLGHHIGFSPFNLGWKEQIGLFLLSLIPLSRGFPPPLLPCNGWSTDLSQHLWVKVYICLRRCTMFSKSSRKGEKDKVGTKRKWRKRENDKKKTPSCVKYAYNWQNHAHLQQHYEWAVAAYYQHLPKTISHICVFH